MLKINILTKLLLLLLAFAMLNCEPKKEPKPVLGGPKISDYPELIQSGKLTFLTENSSSSYFIYKGQPLGFDYELISAFCKAHKLELELIPISNVDSIFHMLLAGKGNVAGANLTVTQERKEMVNFTIPIQKTRQVLVQNNNRKKRVTEILDLAGDTIFVRSGSSFFPRLQSINAEIGGGLTIQTVDGTLETEELIDLVAKDSLSLTVADENIAKINTHLHSNIDVSVPLSFNQQISWAVAPGADSLLAELNTWLDEFTQTIEFEMLVTKYFKARTNLSEKVKSEFSSLNGGKISEYDEVIKLYSKEINWDWRLLASMIYQESRFDPQAKAWTGAQGLMQILPETAEHFKVDSLNNPFENIKAGAAYINWLHNFWQDSIQNPQEEIYFVLGSYNVGAGHILDARRLAEKLGKNKNVWIHNVEDCLRLKSKPEYYNLPEVKYGYCRGLEPYQYVRSIMSRYQHYQNTINE